MTDSYIRPATAAGCRRNFPRGGVGRAASRATQCDGCKRDPEELAGTDQAEQAAGRRRLRSEAEATLVAEPLERGFGVTLGNALRRILLSSLQGAAVQSVHIDGVLHEFSSIAGVREDVTDIVLNIKDIAIKMQGEGPKRMVVKKRGPAPSPPATSRPSATRKTSTWSTSMRSKMEPNTVEKYTSST